MPGGGAPLPPLPGGPGSFLIGVPAFDVRVQRLFLFSVSAFRCVPTVLTARVISAFGGRTLLQSQPAALPDQPRLATTVHGPAGAKKRSIFNAFPCISTV